MNKQSLGMFYKYVKTIERYDRNFLYALCKSINQVEGWLWPYQIFTLYVIASHLKGKLVEIGSWKGKSSSVFCAATESSDVDLYCVDIWQGNEEHKNLDTSNLLNEFKNNLQKFNFLNRVNIQQGPSIEIAKLHADESCDIIFIDAAHDYENVKADILAWYPKLKKRGIMIGHDYPDPSASDFQELKTAVDEEVKNKQELFEDFGYFSGIWGAIKK